MVSVFSKRMIAYVLDFFVISALMWIFSYFLFIVMNPNETYKVYNYVPYVLPVLILIYFIITEKIHGASVGKSLMFLQVRSRNGAKISWPQAILRNLTKIYWIPILFDMIIGMLLKSNDRLFGNLSKTIVLDERKYRL